MQSNHREGACIDDDDDHIRLCVGLGTVLQTLRVKTKIEIINRLLASVRTEMNKMNSKEDAFYIHALLEPFYRDKGVYENIDRIISNISLGHDISTEEKNTLDRYIGIYAFDGAIYLWDVITCIRDLNISLYGKNMLWTKSLNDLETYSTIGESADDPTVKQRVFDLFKTYMEKGIKNEILDRNKEEINQICVSTKSFKLEYLCISQIEQRYSFSFSKIIKDIISAWNDDTKFYNKSELKESGHDLCNAYMANFEDETSRSRVTLFTESETLEIKKHIDYIKCFFTQLTYGSSISTELQFDLKKKCDAIDKTTHMIHFVDEDIPSSVFDAFRQRRGMPEVPLGRTRSRDIVSYDSFNGVRLKYKETLNLRGDGDIKDRVLVQRYNGKEVHQYSEHMNQSILVDLLESMGTEMSTSVIIGGLACLVRNDPANFPDDIDQCNVFIHSYCPEMTVKDRFYADTYKMTYNTIDEKIQYKKIIRVKAIEKFITYNRFYSTCFGGDPDQQKNIDNIFKEFETTRRHGGLHIFQSICKADFIFAEKILVFGLCVLFRGLFETLKKFPTNFRDCISLFDGAGIGRIIYHDATRDILIGSLISSGIYDVEECSRLKKCTPKISIYYHLFSCFIHANDTDPKRLININSIDKYMPLIKMETLTMAFALFQSPMYPYTHYELSPYTDDQLRLNMIAGDQLDLDPDYDGPAGGGAAAGAAGQDATGLAAHLSYKKNIHMEIIDKLLDHFLSLTSEFNILE